jgi:hypothetical protein
MSMWSGKELLLLRALWSTATTAELLAALPMRSLASLAGKAVQLKLGPRDQSLGKIYAKGDVGLDDRVTVGEDLLLTRLRQHHVISDVKEFSL